MLTVGVTSGLTVMVILLLFAVVGEAQVALEVSVQLTTSLLANALLEKLALLVPAFTPFTFHW
jgi:hypothetical protein